MRSVGTQAHTQLPRIKHRDDTLNEALLQPDQGRLLGTHHVELPQVHKALARGVVQLELAAAGRGVRAGAQRR